MTTTLPPPPPPTPLRPRPDDVAPDMPPAATTAATRARPWLTALLAAVVATATTLGLSSSPLLGRGDLASDATPDSSGEVRTVSADGAGGDVATVAAQVAPSVARVTTGGGTDGGPSAVGTGSAVILTADGFLLTNAHVVAGASTVEVTLADGSRYPAEVVGSDVTSDLAVLEVEATDLPAATFADDLPDVGTTAVAIGSPFGLDGTVTSGIVSALDRTLSGAGNALTGLVQTDAAINPGNSGGALADASGQVIGINTAIYSRSGANDGVGFAVPATTATTVARQLIDGGEVVWPVLGVAGQDVTAPLAEAYGLDVDRGALIGEVVAGGAAESAGLRAGDIVVAVDGDDVGSMADLAARIRQHEVGDTLELTVVRDGAELEVDAELTAG